MLEIKEFRGLVAFPSGFGDQDEMETGFLLCLKRSKQNKHRTTAAPRLTDYSVIMQMVIDAQMV